jgi:hypothetical protein
MSFADNYQKCLDKINNRIPIKGITNKLDSKNKLTSFYIFLILIIIIILIIINPFSDNLASSKYNTVTFKLADSNETLLTNFTFKIKDLDTQEIQQHTTDNTGQAKIDLDISKLYEFIVETVGYESKIIDIDPNKLEYKIILEILNINFSNTRTLNFVDKDTHENVTENINLTITCQNTDYSLIPSSGVANGSLEIDVPIDCGNLIASVVSTNYTLTNEIITENNNVVELQEIEAPSETGSIRFIVKSGNTLLSNIQVMIFSENDLIEPIRTSDTSSGQVRFSDLAVGNYKAVTNDPLGLYTSAEINFTINKNINPNKEIELINTRATDGSLEIETRSIKIILKDLQTNQEIIDPFINPIITLLKDGNQTVNLKAYNENGVNFNIESDKDYIITAKATGYLNNTKEVTIGFDEIIIYLEPVTPSNSSNIVVNIYDEDLVAVKNSSVWIYNEDCEYRDPRFSFLISDNNGQVIFEDIPIGSYCIKTIKGPISGVSENFELNANQDSNITLNVFIGEGTINLNVKNKYDDLINNANVEIYNESRELIGSDITNYNNGVFSKKIKADKKVYVKIQKEGYFDYYTNLIPLYANNTISKEIILESNINTQLPIVELIGVYNSNNNQKVQFLSQNQNYYFKFKLINSQTNNFGFKFNIGSEYNVDNDIIYIQEIQSNFETIAYYENSDFTSQVSSEFPSNSINAYWSNPSSAVYELEIPFKVNMSQVGQAVPFKYKIYKNSTTQGPEEQGIYYIDVESLCGDDFCLSGQYQDTIENLIYDIDNQSIIMEVNKPYIFNYKITNASNNVFDLARLLVRNENTNNIQDEKLDFTYYLIKQIINNTSQTNKFSDQDSTTSGQHNFIIPYNSEFLNSDRINVYDDIEFDLEITALDYGQTKINHEIRSQQSVVYDSSIDILVSDESKDMTINYSPENIIPNVPFTLDIFIADKDDFPLQDVVINIYIISNGREIPISSALRTPENGTRSFSIPAINNNEILKIQATKPGYFTEPVEIEIKEDLVDLYKETNSLITENNMLEININRNSQTGAKKSITIKNKTDYELQLNFLEPNDFSFTNSNYLDLQKTLNKINNQIGNESTQEVNFKIQANSQEDLDITFFSADLANNLIEAITITGSITLSFSKVGTTKEFLVNLPIKNLLSIGEGVYFDNCLVVKEIEDTWTDIVKSGRPVTKNFIIENVCVSAENQNLPVSLKNIKAKIVQKGDRYGYYDLAIGSAKKRLREGVYTEIISNIESNREYTFTLSYTVSGVKRGEVETDIYINAEIETDSGIRFVNNDISQIKTKFTIMDLLDCIDFYDGSRKINNVFEIGEETNELDTKELTIKNKCSENVELKLIFCEDNDPGCIDLKRLDFGNLSGSNNDELDFDIGETSQIVDVPKPKIPGAYLLTLDIYALTNNGRKIPAGEKTLKINIKDRLFVGLRENTTTPFIELVKKTDSNGRSYYESEEIVLYNSDINYTPWSYITDIDASNSDKGMAKYINSSVTSSSLDNYDLYSSDFYKIIKYKKLNADSQGFSDYDSGWNWAGSLSGGGSIFGIIGIWASSSHTAAAFLSAITPWGVAALGLISLTSFLANTFDNDYDIDKDYYMDDLDMIDNSFNLISTKEIIVEDSSPQNSYLNIFDITGNKFITYYKTHSRFKGHLSKDETFETQVPICSTNEYLLDKYALVTKKSICDDYDEDDGKIVDGFFNYNTSCDGKWLFGREDLDFRSDVYVVCAKNTEIWPEQAGIKPLKFKIEADSDAYNLLESNGSLYKNFKFYPNFNDDDLNIDLCFLDSGEINEKGDYRFEFHIKDQPEQIDPDLELIDCLTDTGFFGITGEAAVPKVNFDWNWSSIDNINRCDEYYCDATQLTQEILSRIYKAEELIKHEEVECPTSQQEIVDQLNNGRYIINATTESIEQEVTASKVGISKVVLNTDGNIFKVKVDLQNRTDSLQTGSLDLDLVGYTPSKVEMLTCESLLNCDNSLEWTWREINDFIQGVSLDVPYGNKDTRSLIFSFGSENNPIVDDDLDLYIDYSGTNLDIYNSSFYTNLDLSVYESQTYESCLVPATTAILAGTNYIDMWFNKSSYPNNVNSEWDLEEIDQLKNYLEFEANLITDNYTDNFKNDFDRAYNGYASKQEGVSVNTESFFTNTVYSNEELLSPLLKYNLFFSNRFINNNEDVEIIIPGRYKVRIDLFFNNYKWDFLNEDTQVDVNAIVTFEKISDPEDNSAFYRMPFDGSLGYNYTNNSYSRFGYGMSYLGDNILLYESSGSNLFSIFTGKDSGSNPLKYLNIKREDDFFKINSVIDTRGKILTIKNNVLDPGQIDMVFAPSVAKPVLLNVQRNSTRPFSIYYQLKNVTNNNEIIFGNNNLTYWYGVGNYLDFSGSPTYVEFLNLFDRVSLAEEHVPQSYAIDWESVSRTGQVNLRTIFYTPINSNNESIDNYKLSRKSTGPDPSISFYDYESEKLDTEIKLVNSDFQIKKLKDLFKNIKSGNVCVTNSEDGTSSEFWWNPAKIYSKDPVFEGDFDKIDIQPITN